MKKLIRLLMLLSLFQFGCNSDKDGTIVQYYSNGKIKEILVRNGKNKIKYTMSFNKNGNIISYYQKADSIYSQIKMKFNSDGGLKSYSNGKDDLIRNHSITFDSLSRIQNIDLPEYIDSSFLDNQMIFFTKNGLVDTHRSHFILVDTYAIPDSKVRLVIQIVGKRFEKLYALIGDFENNYRLVKSSKVDTFYGKDNIINADIPISRGVYTIKGEILDEGKEKAYPIYFTKEIIAK